MLNLINTKLLIAILAAVTALGGYLYHEHQLHKEQAASAVKAAALLQQQQNQHDDAQKADKRMWDEVREKRRKQNNMPVHGSDPWKHYLP